MSVKLRLTIMSFFQFFCLGSLVNYNSELLVWNQTLGWNPIWCYIRDNGNCFPIYAYFNGYYR